MRWHAGKLADDTARISGRLALVTHVHGYCIFSEPQITAPQCLRFVTANPSPNDLLAQEAVSENILLFALGAA